MTTIDQPVCDQQQNSPVEYVTSADGTRIAYMREGEGPPLIFVTGAFNDRATCAPLAAQLRHAFTVITYDRRGRGDSGDTAPYAVEREIEDLDALIHRAGGTAAVFGYSSGAVLALHAAAGSATTHRISHVIAYEPPFIIDDTAPRPPADLAEQLKVMVAQGRGAEAVQTFQTIGIGLPTEIVAQIRNSPLWPTLEAAAHTTVYDAAITGDKSLPVDELALVRVPTLVLNGAESWPSLIQAAPATAAVVPGATHLEVPGGVNHQIPPAAVAAAVEMFLPTRSPHR